MFDEKPQKPKVATTGQTMASVIKALREMPFETEQRRRDLISACNAVIKMARRPAAAICADAPTLRAIFHETAPAKAGVRQKRFKNIREDVLASCNLAGAIPPLREEAKPVSKGWQEFLECAAAPHHRFTLSRLSYWASAEEIPPRKAHLFSLQRFHRMVG